MSSRFPKKITRRSFLSTSGKLGLATAGILAGSTGLFYYGAVKQRGRTVTERPGNIVELGKASRLTAIKGVEKVSYEATIQDAWVTKSMNGFVYVTNDANGELLIMSPVCTHLGCTIEPEAGLGAKKDLFFRCPCHGAEFDLRGNAVGNGKGLPGLDTFKPMIANGSVYIDLLSPIKGRTAIK